MDEDRIHRVISADGTEIVGRIRGEGPPLVLVHGGLGDGEISWQSLLPFLTDSFTCYLMSTRGRGLSAAPANADFSLERLVQDVVAFAESIGEPVGLVGYSLGGSLALGAAAHSTAVAAVAVFEPPVFEVHRGDEDFARSLAGRVGEAVGEDRLADAARITVEGVAREGELAALSAAGAFETWSRNVLVALQEMEQAGAPGVLSPTAPARLAQITAPVLYLHGSLTPTTWYRDGARHVAGHVAGVRVHEVPEVGHFGPPLSPDPIATELIRFFEGIPELSERPGSPPGATREEDMTTQTDQPTLTRVTSPDGTHIGYFTRGEGPPLVLVHGALGDHSRWSAMLPYLEPHFTVHAMDRRGRGASGDHPDYDFSREVEDVAAVVDALAEDTGARVDVMGSSVGATFALQAASLTSNMRRLVLFEPPGPAVMDLLPAHVLDRLDELLEADDREGILDLAYRVVAGMSEAEIEHLRGQPEWSQRLAAAHTVPRELRTPRERMFDLEQAATVTAPTLVLLGDQTSEAYLRSSEAVVEAVPSARLILLEGQNHGAEMFAPAVVAEPVLAFLRE